MTSPHTNLFNDAPHRLSSRPTAGPTCIYLDNHYPYDVTWHPTGISRPATPDQDKVCPRHTQRMRLTPHAYMHGTHAALWPSTLAPRVAEGLRGGRQCWASDVAPGSSARRIAVSLFTGGAVTTPSPFHRRGSR